MRPSLFASSLLMTSTLLTSTTWSQNVVAPFDVNYSLFDLGSVPGVQPSYGGITFHPTDANTILIGGAANGSTGVAYAIGVVRDAQNHITGFNGSATYWCDTPYIDGGLQFGPNNVLFSTGWPTNVLNQVPFGQTAVAKQLDLTAAGITSSVGAFQIVPPGFPNAGRVKLVSYTSGEWYTCDLVPDGLGTFDLGNVTLGQTTGAGPEGLLYPPAGSPGLVDFGSVLVSEWNVGEIAHYLIDANGDAIPATRQVFVTGLSGALGAVVDPVTGDYLFSTFGGGDHVVAIRGFATPTCSGSATPYGPSTPGSGGFTPQLNVVGTPCVGNALSALGLSNAIGGGFTVLVLGLAPVGIPAPFYGGTLLVAPFNVLSFPIGGVPGVPGTGGFTFPIPVPNDPFLAGANLYLQAIVVDPGAVAGYSFSQGLQVTIG